jgi:glutaredoxin 2
MLKEKSHLNFRTFIHSASMCSQVDRLHRITNLLHGSTGINMQLCYNYIYIYIYIYIYNIICMIIIQYTVM